MTETPTVYSTRCTVWCRGMRACVLFANCKLTIELVKVGRIFGKKGKFEILPYLDTPLAYYYLIGRTIYQAPDMSALLQCRMVSYGIPTSEKSNFWTPPPPTLTSQPWKSIFSSFFTLLFFNLSRFSWPPSNFYVFGLCRKLQTWYFIWNFWMFSNFQIEAKASDFWQCHFRLIFFELNFEFLIFAGKAPLRLKLQKFFIIFTDEFVVQFAQGLRKNARNNDLRRRK